MSYQSQSIHHTVSVSMQFPNRGQVPNTNKLPKSTKFFCRIANIPFSLSSIPHESYPSPDLFRLCPPSLVGAYYLQPPDARAIFLHNDLLCNDTCSVTGGSITYWGGTNGKDPRIQRSNCCHCALLQKW